jgi:hypothetical protein
MTAISPRREFVRFTGKSLDGLSVSDRWKLAGTWMATELYSPERLPLRVMEAIGADAVECIGQLRERGLDPELFEYTPIPQPYEP